MGDISIVGGAFELGRSKTICTVAEYAEFNFYTDPEAAKIILISNINTKIELQK